MLLYGTTVTIPYARPVWESSPPRILDPLHELHKIFCQTRLAPGTIRSRKNMELGIHVFPGVPQGLLKRPLIRGDLNVI
jgi:hypothetical protein